jgi:hypothetical protein
MATLDSIADEIGYSRNELMQSMVKFGLTNRDWRNEGLTAHKRLPRYEENPMATKPPSPAQLAARERFAEMARSGSLNRKRQIAAKKRKANPTGLKFQVGKYYETRSIGDANIKIGATILDRTDKTVKVKGTDGQMKSSYRLTIDYDGNERFYPWGRYSMAPQISADDEKPKRNPAKKTVSQKISQLVHEGYPQRQAVAVALNEQRAGKVKRNPSNVRYRDLAKDMKAHHVAGYAVHKADRPYYLAAAWFSNKKDAVEVAQEVADRTGIKYAVSKAVTYFGPK